MSIFPKEMEEQNLMLTTGGITTVIFLSFISNVALFLLWVEHSLDLQAEAEVATVAVKVFIVQKLTRVAN